MSLILLLVHLFTLALLQPSFSHSCVTVPTHGGSPGGERCVFPFRFRGKFYTSCTKDLDPNEKLWCSTLVDRYGNHIVKENRWGHCDVATCSKDGQSKKCFTIGGRTHNRQCVFPFNHKDKTYHKCTLAFAHDGVPWCSTRTNNRGDHILGHWGHCDCNDGEDCCSFTSWTSKTTSTPPGAINFGQDSNDRGENSGKCLPGIDKCALENLLSLEDHGIVEFVGGTDTDIFLTPFMALIGSKRTSDGDGKIRYRCGGSLINKKYVLSAAHCFVSKKFESVEVVLGEFDVTTDPDCASYDEEYCAEKVQKIPIEKIIIHEGYTGKRNHLNDIALVRMAKPARYSESVKPVCLPLDTRLVSRILKVDNIIQGLNGNISYGMGWGRTEYDNNGDFDDHGVSSTRLQYGKLRFISNEECREKIKLLFGSRRGDIREEIQVCSGDDGADTCSGDSGGPLMAPGYGSEFGESLIQIGIVSFGSRTCGDGTPAVYTRVSAYIDWIKTNLED